jgi:hypothetical protein
MEHGWTTDGGPPDVGDPDLDAEVFRRVFGYLPAPGVNVPRFSRDWDMATAILSHVWEAWRPLSIDVRQRPTTDPGLAWEVNIRTGKESGYGGHGPTREIAICEAALFLAANRGRKWNRTAR